MTQQEAKARTVGLSREEEVLAYCAIGVLLAAIGLVVGAIFTGA